MLSLSETARNAKRETSKSDRSHAIIMDVESVTREPESRSRRRRLDLIRRHSRGGAVPHARDVPERSVQGRVLKRVGEPRVRFATSRLR